VRKRRGRCRTRPGEGGVALPAGVSRRRRGGGGVVALVGAGLVCSGGATGRSRRWLGWGRRAVRRAGGFTGAGDFVAGVRGGRRRRTAQDAQPRLGRLDRRALAGAAHRDRGPEGPITHESRHSPSRSQLGHEARSPHRSRRDPPQPRPGRLDHPRDPGRSHHHRSRRAKLGAPNSGALIPATPRPALLPRSGRGPIKASRPEPSAATRAPARHRPTGSAP